MTCAQPPICSIKPPALPCLSFLQGAWRRQPYDEIEFEEIESFVVAEDCGEERDAAALPTKLLTNLTPEAAAAAAGGRRLKRRLRKGRGAFEREGEHTLLVRLRVHLLAGLARSGLLQQGVSATPCVLVLEPPPCRFGWRLWCRQRRAHGPS